MSNEQNTEMLIDFIDDDWTSQDMTNAVFKGKKSCQKRNTAIAFFVFKKEIFLLKELPEEILYKPYNVEETESYFDWKTMKFENVKMKYAMILFYLFMHNITDEDIYSVFNRSIDKSQFITPSFDIGLLNHFDKTSLQLA